MLLSLLELGCCRKDPGLRAGGRLPPARPSRGHDRLRERARPSLLCVLRRRGGRGVSGRRRARPGPSVAAVMKLQREGGPAANRGAMRGRACEDRPGLSWGTDKLQPGPCGRRGSAGWALRWVRGRLGCPVWVLRPPVDPVCGAGESGAEASGPAGHGLPSQRPAPARLRRAALGE